MKIRYKMKRLIWNLIIGVFLFIYGLWNIFTEVKLRWADFGYLAISIPTLAQYFYEVNKQYLTIENGIICKNSLFSKKINLSDIIEIKKLTRKYILKTVKTQLKINTRIIEDKSLNELDKLLEKLNLEWN